MSDVLKILRLISRQSKAYDVPSVTLVSYGGDPYQVLVSCLLSLRTRDKTTIEASRRLFKVAKTPEDMLKLSLGMIRRLIYPVGFYRNKGKVILEASRRIVDEYSGKVPSGLDELLDFRGVGRKTANLVLGLGFRKPAICVDTHVHRISNRLGWVRTHSPENTEIALRKIIPRKYWIKLNTLLVAFGQNLCLPLSPLCSECPVYSLCKRTGVIKYR